MGKTKSLLQATAWLCEEDNKVIFKHFTKTEGEKRALREGVVGWKL